MNENKIINLKNIIKALDNEINSLNEIILKLSDSISNEWIDEKRKKDLENHKNTLLDKVQQKYKYEREILGLKNLDAVTEKMHMYLTKDISLDDEKRKLFQHFKMDDRCNEIFNHIIFSDNMKIEDRYDALYIKDNRMLIDTLYEGDWNEDYKNGKLNFGISELKNIRLKIGFNLCFNPKSNIDLIEKYGKLWIRENAIIILNKYDHAGDYFTVSTNIYNIKLK